MSYAQILVIPVEKDVEEHFRNLRERLHQNDILYDSAMQQIELTESYLREKQNS